MNNSELSVASWDQKYAIAAAFFLPMLPRIDRPLLRAGGLSLLKQADDDEDFSTETEKMMKVVPGLKGAMLYARRRRIKKSYRIRSGRVHREAEAHKPTQTKARQRRRH